MRNDTDNAFGVPGNMFSPFSNFGDPAVVGLDYNQLASIRSVSDFNSAELNLRQRLPVPASCVQATALFGLRYVNIGEQFQYRTQSLVPVGVGATNAVDVSTGNSMFGVQAGGKVSMQFERRVWIDFEVKFLLLHNSASQQTDYTYGPIGGPDSTITGAHSQGLVTLGTDLAITGMWQFTPWLVGQLGYQGIFLDGLALASNNFTQNAPLMTIAPTELSYNGHLAFHGPFAGLTATW